MTIAAVRHNGVQGTSSSGLTHSITLPSVGVGDLLVLAGYFNAASTVTVTDGVNTWEQVGEFTDADGRYGMFAARNVAASGSTLTVTATLNSSQAFVDLLISEYSADNGWAAIGATANATGTGTALAVATLTPTSSPNVMVAFWATDDGTITPGGGFTTRVTQFTDAEILADLIQNSSTTASTAPATAGSALWIAQASLFYESATVHSFTSASAALGALSATAALAEAPAHSFSGATADLGAVSATAALSEVPANSFTSATADLGALSATAALSSVTVSSFTSATAALGALDATTALSSVAVNSFTSATADLGALSAIAELSNATVHSFTGATATLGALTATAPLTTPGAPSDVNPYWPKVSFQVAFNADPNDPDTPPEWSDLTRRLLSWDSSFGRQYETDTNQSGEADAVLDDPDEDLNPANTGSPFAGGLFPMRQYVHQVMWPPQPVDTAVNMMNHWSGFDPTFESYILGRRPDWVTEETGSGVSPTITDTLAFEGNQSLTWNVAGVSDISGIGWLVYTIPGDTYTVSAYLQQTAANATHLYVNGGDVGADTTATGTWERLTLTFTAWEWTHLLWVRSNPTSHAGTCYLDAVQVEPGDTMSAFDDSGDGPVVYGISKGFVERWPSTWTFNGLRGQCQIECVDAMAALARIGMAAEYPAALAAATPTWWWRLNDQTGATQYADQAGLIPVFLQVQNSANGAGQVSAGSDLTYPGNPSGLGANITGTSITGPDAKGSGLTAGFTGPPLGLGGSTGSGDRWGLTLAIAFNGGAPADLTSTWNLVTLTSKGGYFNPAGGSYLSISVGPNIFGEYGFLIDAGRWVGTTPGWSGSLIVADNGTDSGAYFDGSGKLFIVTLVWDGTELTIGGQIEALDAIFHTVSSATIGGLPINLDAIQIGGIYDKSTAGVDQSDLAGYDTTYAEVALWNTDLGLNTTTTNALFDAFAGFTGEFPGERISRWLATYFHEYATYTSIDSGTSLMGSGNVDDTTKLLDAIQYVTTSENGDYWIDQWGVHQFTARTDRWRKTSATWVLGEDLAGGEYPYLDTIEFDFDDTQTYNVIQVTQTGGLVYTAQDEASQRRYFPSELDIEIGLEDAEDVVAAGDWLLATHKDAQQRVSGLQVNPGANPALWRFVLGARKGDRVTVMRRTKPGVVVDLDFFIERIEHAHSAGSWITSYEASPVAGQMAWILGDANLSKLGFTTRLGY